MKSLYQLLITCLLLSVGQTAFGDSVIKKVHFSQTKLKCDTINAEDGQVYNLLSYPETESDYYSIGAPALPIKYITIPLPYTANDISLSIRNNNTTSFVIDKKIFPIQKQEATSIEMIQNEFTPCDSRIYESVASYPLEQAKIAEISCVGHGDRLVVVAVYPVTYNPTANRYEFSEDIELTLTYNHSSRRAEDLAHNTNTIDIGIPFYEYCVITSQELKNDFARLIAWRREKGLNAGIVCKEEILNNQYIVGDTVSNIYDDAGKIRQYLQYAYNSGVTKYVLFGGNDSILPIRYGTGDNNRWTSNSADPDKLDDYKIPSDFYFCELNSNWNRDGDKYYGEPEDKLDYGAELYVGRLLCTNSEQIHNYTDKLLWYELNPGNGDFSYLKKALYTEADMMQEKKQQDSIAVQLHSVFPINTIIAEEPSGYDLTPTSPCGSDIIAEMNKHYGFVSWSGHGGPHNICVRTNGNNNGNWYGITSVQTNLPFLVPESANGLDKLTNKHYPMIAYSISCSITPFDAFHHSTEIPNMGQSFTLGKNYGGPVLVGNTRNGWTNASFDLQLIFNNALLKDSIVGAAQNYAKLKYTGSLKNYLAHTSNIIGCPNVRVWTDIPKFFSATLSYNSNNYTISANNHITDAEIGIRDITQLNEIIETATFNPSQGEKEITGITNRIVTLTGKNCLPQILPLTIQNAILQGTHYAIVKDVTCGKDIRKENQGDVIFDENSDYIFETKGTFKLTKGVKIKEGAHLKVISSKINY